MRAYLILVFCLIGCGGDFQIPERADMRISIDFSGYVGPGVDADCFNTACGGCSNWRNWDGKPAKVGDPCLYRGVYECQGTNLVCNDTSCPSCAQAIQGTVCGADGHTVYLIGHTGPICTVSDTGSATGVCAKNSSDKCLGRCTLQGSTYDCSATCASNDANTDGGSTDGGTVTGCEYDVNATCTTLAGC